ncbi:Zinc finger RING-type [Arabidopsis thaliana x Arabidopsis arenosa]|uniref:Zinc finger RING-type n=1 Tax=Arabidopsis thaliana x Arabidopsis arenosa TaxID=1240361 RepID=A0A8T2BZL3_9BRAS|nr:Zinc finger RING-type [Arabidopsis thaliana x Arabidopsis arenosa]
MTSPPSLFALSPAAAAAAADLPDDPNLTIVGFLKSPDSLPLYLLITMIVYTVQHRYCNCRFKQKTKPLKKEILKSLPKLTFSPECGVRLCSSRCVICLEDYVVGDMVRVLPHCGHEFHAFCIDKWFQLGSTCPSCRSIPVIYHPLLNVLIHE